MTPPRGVAVEKQRRGNGLEAHVTQLGLKGGWSREESEERMGFRVGTLLTER